MKLDERVKMSTNTFICPTCGRTGTDTGDWVTPGIAAGKMMTGLDPEHCEGCREVLNKNGYAVVKINPNGDGTGTVEVE